MEVYLLCNLALHSVLAGNKKKEKDGGKQRSLGQQAELLYHERDRLQALRRITCTMQVQLSRTLIMKALSLLSLR